jgi:hypothetical protein
MTGGFKLPTDWPGKLTKPIFGTEYNYAESEGVSSRSTLSYDEKVSLTTGVIPAGDYLIEWSCEVANSSKDKMVGVRVQIDDTTTIAEVMKPKVDGNNEYVSMGGLKVITLTNASHDIDMDYEPLSDTASIRRARIVLWRVS